MRILENRRGSTVFQAVFEKIKNLFTLIYVANISIIKHVTNCHRSVTLIPGTVLKSENETVVTEFSRSARFTSSPGISGNRTNSGLSTK